MQADTEDRYTEEPQQSGGLPKLPIALGVAAALIAIGWYFSGSDDTPEAPPPSPAQTISTPATVIAEPAPDIPVVEETETLEIIEVTETAPPPAPPVTLDTSDPVVRESATESISDPLFAPSLNQENLIERATALIDASSSGALLRKVLALPAVEGDFAVVESAGRTTLDPAGYNRYDKYAEAVEAINAQQLSGTFHQFRSLLEQAYASLGYPADDLDNTLIRALDQVIAAPVLDSPPELVKDVTTYKFVDPVLEQQSPLAKQLMRMGPENQRVVQQKARELRKALLGG